MDWYERLNEYFSDQELKDLRQMQDLIDEKEGYKKEETDDYILMYAEFPTFLFIDYLLVNPKCRGKGVGGKILNKLKQKGKTILLEVEPADHYDEDTLKRIHFYEKNGFSKADRIQYRRKDENGKPFEMDIYYWSPEDISQSLVMDQMAKACEEIHNFRSKKYYGRIVANPDEVLKLKKQ